MKRAPAAERTWVRRLRRLRACLFVTSGSFAVAALASAPVACRTATEVTIDVTTDIACVDARGSSVTVGRLGSDGGIEDKPAASTSMRCDAGRLGALVIVPSGASDDEVAFKIVMGFTRQVESCVVPYGKGCIVARRALRFLPHAGVTVPVVMRSSCDGIACRESETCVRGECRDARIPDASQCGGAGCGEERLAAIGGDGGVPDGGVSDGGSPDANEAGKDAGGADGGVTTVDGCDMRGLQAGAAWPMGGYCPSLRRRSPYRGPTTTPRVQFNQMHGASGAFAVVIDASGVLYVATQDARVLALDPATGVPRWSNPFVATTADGGAASGITTNMAIGVDGTIYVGSTYGIHAIDPATGTARWPAPYAAAGPRWGLGVDATGALIFTNNTPVVEAVRTGATPVQKWFYSGSSAFGPPAVDVNGNVFFASDDGILRMLDSTGALVRPIAITGLSSDTVVVARDGTLRVQSDPARKLFARTVTGAFVFDAPTGLEPNDLAVADDGTNYLGLDDGTLHAIGPTGVEPWTPFGAGLGNFSPTIGADGTIYFMAAAGSNHVVYALSPAGTKLWELTLPSTAGDAPGGVSIGANGWLYFATSSGHVFGVGL
jgi:outer membrane protein assembly factor BamB